MSRPDVDIRNPVNRKLKLWFFRRFYTIGVTKMDKVQLSKFERSQQHPLPIQPRLAIDSASWVSKHVT